MATDTSARRTATLPVPGRHRLVTQPPAERPDQPAPSDRFPRPWLFPVAVFAVAWLLILASWYGYDALFGHHFGWDYFFGYDDAGFYRAIAEWSYTGDPARPAFFPLFPIVIRLAADVAGGNYAVGGLIAGVLSGLASVVAVWALARQVCTRRVADYAVLLFALFPGAMAFAINYSEPLAVAIAAAMLLALLKRRWLLAGILGALGTAERPTLIVLAVVGGVVAIQAIRERREWAALLAPALTPAGILAYFAFLGHRFHNYKYWFWIENKGWHQHFDWGAHTFSVLLWINPTGEHHKRFVVMLTIMFACAVAGIILMLAARLPVALSLFAILTILLTITSSNGGTRPRFVWVAFPIFLGAAAKLPRWLYWPVLILSAAGFVLLAAGWRALFGPHLAP